MPTRSCCGVTRQGWAANRATASGVNQSVRGPSTTSSVTVSPARGSGGGLRSGAPTALPVGAAPIGRRWPLVSAGGPILASVSRLALPSTGATSRPPRTAT